MAKLTDLPLDELYARKQTPKVIEAIQLKDSFEEINPRYCQVVCTIPPGEKDPESVDLDVGDEGDDLDILVVSSCPPADDKYRAGREIARQHREVLSYILTSIKVKPGRWDHAFLSKCPLGSGKRSATASRKCVPYLLAQIRRSNPKVIVATSAEVRAALKVKSTGKNRGAIHFASIGGREIPVVSTIHPALLSMIRQNSSGDMWGSEYYSILKWDLTKARDISQGKLGNLRLGAEAATRKAIEDGDLIITRSLDEVATECGKILASVKLVSWDIEATGLDPWHPNARVLCMQFGYRENDRVKAVVVPLWHRANLVYDANEAWMHVRKILESPDIVKVGHNMKFDLLYTSVVTGVRPAAAELDTMLLLHALNSGIQGNYGLKTAVWDYLWDTGLGGYEDELGEGEDEDNEDTEDECANNTESPPDQAVVEEDGV